MAEAQLQLPPSPTGPTRVLIVDDNRGDRLLCSKHLLGSRNQAYEILEADCGRTALQTVASQSVDCVLLDHYLPDGEGIGLIPSLREASADAHLAVVLLTGRGDEAIAVDALQGGANDYVPKSRLSTSTMDRVIANALEKSDLKRLVDIKRQKLEVTIRTLRARNLEIREFYQTVSHELKTPITAIREYNSLMLEGFGGEVSDVHADYLERSVACCDRLTRLVDDLLDVARLETGKLRVEMTRGDISQPLAHCVDLLQPLAGNGEMKLTYAPGKALPDLNFDPNRITQIITNLVTNAIKNTPAGGSITVHTEFEPASQSVRIHVTDTGCGISEADQAQIFERYFQVKESD